MPKADRDSKLAEGTDLGGWDQTHEQGFSVRRRSTWAHVSGMFASPTIVVPSEATVSFSPVILAIRWGCLTISLLLAALEVVDDPWLAVFAAGAFVLQMVRTYRPIAVEPRGRTLVGPVVELMLVTAAVASTGRWSSPLLMVLVATVVVLGFRAGIPAGAGAVVASATAVTIVDQLSGSPHNWALAGQWIVQLILVVVVTSYARRITGESSHQHRLALSRLGQLTDANALLFSLHRVAQTLPASLDLQEVLDSTVSRLRGLFDIDRMVIFLHEETDGSWEAVVDEGIGLQRRMGLTSLAEPLRKAIAENGIVSVSDLSGHGPGLHESSGSGMYAVLSARGAIVGLLAVEHAAKNHYSARDGELLAGFVEPVALAIDNGRWFRRLRTTGAAEERTRIARDLHDRIGQSLAYVAFELDRLIKRDASGDSVTDELAGLRGEVRQVIGEVRETLFDLRTDVSDEKDFARTMSLFTERVAERSGLAIDLDLHSAQRLNILREREMWRIAQEALTNVERHAEASHVVITWRCDGTSATVRIEDNGKGFEADSGRSDSYGLLGMRERAASIGAVLEVSSQPGQGTAVICRLGAMESNQMDPARLLKDLPLATDRNRTSTHR